MIDGWGAPRPFWRYGSGATDLALPAKSRSGMATLIRLNAFESGRRQILPTKISDLAHGKGPETRTNSPIAR
jgi:hypothetical protein